MDNEQLKLVIEAVDKASAQIKAIQGNISKMGESAVQDTKKMDDGFTRVAKTLAGFARAKVMMDFTTSVSKAAQALEVQKVAYTGLLGSGLKADKMLRDLTEFAIKTPFEITGIRETAKQLMAVGVAAKDVIPLARNLGDLSLGDSVKFGRLAYAFGQVKSAGKLMGTELRQITETGVPIREALANQMQIPIENLAEAISNGEVKFKDFQKAITALAESPQFKDQMAKGAETLQGKLSNLSDIMTKLKEKFGAPMNDLIKPVVQLLTDALTGLFNVFNMLSPAWQNFISFTILASGTVGALSLALFSMNAMFPNLITGVLKFASSFTSLLSVESIIAGLKASLMFLTTPLGILVVAVTLLASAWVTNFGHIQERSSDLGVTIKGFASDVSEDFASLISVFQTTDEVNAQMAAGVSSTDKVMQFLIGTVQQIIVIFQNAYNTIKLVVQVGYELAKVVGMFLVQAFNVLGTAIGDVFNALPNAFKKATQMATQFAQTMAGVAKAIASGEFSDALAGVGKAMDELGDTKIFDFKNTANAWDDLSKAMKISSNEATTAMSGDLENYVARVTKAQEGVNFLNPQLSGGMAKKAMEEQQKVRSMATDAKFSGVLTKDQIKAIDTAKTTDEAKKILDSYKTILEDYSNDAGAGALMNQLEGAGISVGSGGGGKKGKGKGGSKKEAKTEAEKAQDKLESMIQSAEDSGKYNEEQLKIISEGESAAVINQLKRKFDKMNSMIEKGILTDDQIAQIAGAESPKEAEALRKKFSKIASLTESGALTDDQLKQISSASSIKEIDALKKKFSKINSLTESGGLTDSQLKEISQASSVKEINALKKKFSKINSMIESGTLTDSQIEAISKANSPIVATALKKNFLKINNAITSGGLTQKQIDSIIASPDLATTNELLKNIQKTNSSIKTGGMTQEKIDAILNSSDVKNADILLNNLKKVKTTFDTAGLGQSKFDSLLASMSSTEKAALLPKVQQEIANRQLSDATGGVFSGNKINGGSGGGYVYKDGGVYFEKRASGGPVNAGQPYIVGEKGQELFVPGQSGTIVSNDKYEAFRKSGFSESVIKDLKMADDLRNEFSALNVGAYSGNKLSNEAYNQATPMQKQMSEIAYALDFQSKQFAELSDNSGLFLSHNQTNSAMASVIGFVKTQLQKVQGLQMAQYNESRQQTAVQTKQVEEAQTTETRATNPMYNFGSDAVSGGSSGGASGTAINIYLTVSDNTFYSEDKQSEFVDKLTATLTRKMQIENLLRK